WRPESELEPSQPRAHAWAAAVSLLSVSTRCPSIYERHGAPHTRLPQGLKPAACFPYDSLPLPCHAVAQMIGQTQGKRNNRQRGIGLARRGKHRRATHMQI